MTDGSPATGPLELRGTTWDHPRGLAPLLALAELPRLGVHVDWSARSLHAFGEQAIGELTDDYDLLVIDHPSMGDGATDGLLLPLDDLVDPALLGELAGASVGPSYASYLVDGRPYALPIDAAGHVSAGRPGLLSREAWPTTWAEVVSLAESRPEGARVALPLKSIDVWCLFLTLLASSGRPIYVEPARIADRVVAQDALALMSRLAELVHPDSWQWNPIRVLDTMSSSDEVAYCPALFGYVNYAGTGHERLIDFAAVPSWEGRTPHPLIGGAGIAVSARCEHPEEAAAVAAYLCTAPVQCGPYLTAGGQPGHRAAWIDAAANARTNGFFEKTLPGLDAGYLRSRLPGFTGYQEWAGELLVEVLRGSTTPDRAIDALDERWRGLNAGIR